MTNNNIYTLNFGPHHPSTHGVLRLFLELEGEKVVSCNPDVGYLHRGIEKRCENTKFLSIIPFIDRIDYLASLICEHAYINAIEKSLKIKPTKRAIFIRTILDELTRISSHIMAIGSATHDIGCMSLFLYGFEEREKIMDIFESITGARMHQAFYIPGGILKDISENSLNQIKNFILNLSFYIEAVEKLALNNPIFAKRTKNIGSITKESAIKNGLSGIILRASGVCYDIRDSENCEIYKQFNFEPLTLNDCDCFARTQLRFMEIQQSAKIIQQCISCLPKGGICSNSFFTSKLEQNTLQEILRSNFFATGIMLPANYKIYSAVESPRGEFGVNIITSEKSNKPYRIHFKSPSFAIIQYLKKLLIGSTLSDITAILGSLDFNIGDCDR